MVAQGHKNLYGKGASSRWSLLPIFIHHSCRGHASAICWRCIIFGWLVYWKWAEFTKLLKCFEEASGLRINLNKSRLFRVGINKSEVSQRALSLLCSAGDLPFTYLGLPIGGNMKRLDSWTKVEEKMSKKLNTWKARTLSMRGRLTLVKSVLSILPVYYFSLFHISATVVTTLEKVHNKFLSGAGAESRKIIWRILQNQQVN